MILGLFKNKLNEEDHKHVINYIITEEANQQWIYHVLENNFNKESFRGLPFAKNVLNSFVTMNLDMKASDQMLSTIADLGFRKCREEDFDETGIQMSVEFRKLIKYRLCPDTDDGFINNYKVRNSYTNATDRNSFSITIRKCNL